MKQNVWCRGAEDGLRRGGPGWDIVPECIEEDYVVEVGFDRATSGIKAIEFTLIREPTEDEIVRCQAVMFNRPRKMSNSWAQSSYSGRGSGGSCLTGCTLVNGGLQAPNA